MLSGIEYLFSKIIKKLHLRAVKNCTIHRTSKLCAGTQMVDSEMGRYSDIGYDCTVVRTKIGSFVSIGSNCKIGGAGHTVEWVSTSPVFNENKDHLPKKFSKHKFTRFTDTTIGNDVWIADCVLIKAGVTIGDGAVIGMGSVVTKNVPPYEIWAGNPAKILRKRFDDYITNMLLSIRWWDWNDSELSIKAKYFNDVSRFIESEQK
jgi:acetyltransferase-like isoleucine patch superfamily enzyme